MQKRTWVAGGLLVLVTSLATAFLLGAFSPAPSLTPALLAAPSPQGELVETPSTATGNPLPSLAPMIDEVLPAVVNISTEKEITVQQNPLFQDPFFRHFFNVPNRPLEQKRRSLGSGVIVDSEKGYVLTNHHVVDGADEVKVTLHSGESYDAKIIGSDSEVDLAIVQIKAPDLTALPLADTDDLRVGDFVVAIGNPFGLGQTVTSGIVSALGRTGLGLEGYEDFIQTDASINPGNSGGALVNLRGELVGINTAIVGPSGGNVGIGFAIPTNMAQGVMKQLIEYGEVKRGQLGVYIQDLSPELAKAMDVGRDEGVVVTKVIAGSPADKAGLKNGDVILSVDGKAIANGSQLRNTVGLSPIGKKIEIHYLRGKHEKTTMATIKERTTEKSKAKQIDKRLEGAVLGNIEDGHPLHGEVEGVEVLSVEQGSAAAQSGLRQGDIITEVNREPVTNLDQLQRLVHKSSGALLLHVRRGEGAFYLVIE